MKDKKLKNAMQYIKDTGTLCNNQYGIKLSRSIHITGVSAMV